MPEGKKPDDKSTLKRQTIQKSRGHFVVRTPRCLFWIAGKMRRLRLGRCFPNCKFDPLVTLTGDTKASWNQEQHSGVTSSPSHQANHLQPYFPMYTRQAHASTRTHLPGAAAQPELDLPCVVSVEITVFRWQLRRERFGFNMKKKLSKRLSRPKQTITHALPHTELMTLKLRAWTKYYP